eukprot:193260-Pyramimonas_sp.AAC.1
MVRAAEQSAAFHEMRVWLQKLLESDDAPITARYVHPLFSDPVLFNRMKQYQITSSLPNYPSDVSSPPQRSPASAHEGHA